MRRSAEARWKFGVRCALQQRSAAAPWSKGKRCSAPLQRSVTTKVVDIADCVQIDIIGDMIFISMLILIWRNKIVIKLVLNKKISLICLTNMFGIHLASDHYRIVIRFRNLVCWLKWGLIKRILAWHFFHLMAFPLSILLLKVWNYLSLILNFWKHIDLAIDIVIVLKTQKQIDWHISD